MSRKPEEYARLLASALSKLHAAECRGPSPLLSADSVRLISATIAAVVAETRAEEAERSKVVQPFSTEPAVLH